MLLILLLANVATAEETKRPLQQDTPSEETLLKDDLQMLETKQRKETRGTLLQVDKISQQVYPLLYDGLDKQLAESHTSLASKTSTSSIDSLRFVDFISQAPPKLLSTQGLLIQCSGNRSSMSRIRMMYQKGNNALNYYELEKAEEYFRQAASDILCLKDHIDIEVISQIYYLSGIVNQELGHSNEAYNDFKRALIFTPEFSWNNTYSPDLKTSFDLAAKDFAAQEDINLTVYPSTIRQNILINGQELSPKGIGIVNAGMNVIQVYGEYVNTYFLQVSDSTSDLEIVFPAGLPSDGLSWVNDENKIQELEICLEGMFLQDTSMYIHHDRMVLEHTVGSDLWKELDISTLNRSTLWLRSEKFAKSLQFGGLGLTAMAGSVTVANLLLAYRYNNQAQMTDTFPIYDDNRTKYNNIADNHSLWLTGTLVGLSLTGIGFTLNF